MEIEILELLEGARKARGCTVIIDVFRAFSLEPFLLDQNAKELTAVETVETAWKMRKEDPDLILMGERHGRILDGFDYGNSPASIRGIDFTGKRIAHTTSAGTRGLAGAVNASRLFAASLVNSMATAKVIQAMNPDHVSLVCMGWECHRNTEEDLLCAEYIRSILMNEPMKDIRERADYLRYQEGKKFFDPAQADVFPMGDFFCCIDVDRFDFAMEAVRNENGFRMKKVTP